MSDPTRGRFVVFEGGEACGKSTQTRLLAEALDAVETREPGGTAIGESIRSILLDPANWRLDARAEALLMAAARAQHVAEVIEPALRSGRHVVSDRYVGSSIAYQAYGRGLDAGAVRQLSELATGGLWPDLVVLLQVSPTTAAERLAAARDRIESAGDDFHARVAAGFAELAEQDPHGWVVVDGEASIEDVSATVRAAVSERLGVALS